jgi:hypothetical protein
MKMSRLFFPATEPNLMVFKRANLMVLNADEYVEALFPGN